MRYKMKKIVTFLLLIAFLNTQAICFAADNSVKVNGGINIPVVVTYLKTSKNTVAGEKINASVEEDIKINEVVVFKKGDKVTLNVADVKKSGFVGNPGEMLIVNGKIFDTNGDEHNIEYYHKITGEEKTYPKVLLGVSLFFLWPLALFGFVKGGDAKVVQHAPIGVSLKSGFDFMPQNL